MSTICNFGTENFHIHYSIGEKDSEQTKLHCHSNYEIYFYKAGGVEYNIEGEKFLLEPNDLLLMGPQTFHGYSVQNPEKYERCVISFNEDVLSSFCKKQMKKLYDNAQGNMINLYSNTQDFNISSYFQNLINCEHMNDTIRAKALIANFESLIYQISFMYDFSGKNLIANSTVPDKINEMIKYINTDIEKNFTLDELSQKFFISKHHLNKVFKQVTGTTVMEYILYKKMAIAKQAILKGESVTKIALKIGFNDYSTFYKNYKKIIGNSPSSDKKG